MLMPISPAQAHLSHADRFLLALDRPLMVKTISMAKMMAVRSRSTILQTWAWRRELQAEEARPNRMATRRRPMCVVGGLAVGGVVEVAVLVV